MCRVGSLSADCTEEQWLVIPYLPNYHASCQGRIRNALTGRIKREDRSWNGYYRVQIWKRDENGRHNKHYRIHKLVAATWICDNIELDVNHKDLNRTNNWAYNLEYLTHQENCNYEPETTG